MTISIWRYSHLALAVSSFLFIALASVTGVLLAFDPVSQKIQPYRAGNFKQLSLADALPAIRAKFSDISEVTVDANGFVIVQGTNAQDKSVVAYVDPGTGEQLGIREKKSAFFQWVTDFHRSLFLHGTGRFFVGLTAFLLLLIATSGTILVIQRQRGVKRFFTRIVRDNFAQYYHVVLGRLSLIPIIIIALSGTVLSLNRFGIIAEKKIAHKIDFDTIRSGPQQKLSDFAIFKNTPLSRVQSVEFPFSEDPEDYYTLKLKDRELIINQITGDILSEAPYPATLTLTNLSLNLHTGRASGVWAVILAIASLNILFFIWSGFAITLKRRAGRVINKYKAEKSRFIILVGSENGSTFRFAKAVHEGLIKNGETSFLTELNDYTVFPQADYLIVITATYGLGNPPANAVRFVRLLEKHGQARKIHFSVVGFGSHAYPDFCKFAFEVNNWLAQQAWAVPLLEIHTVNDKSPVEFGLWAEFWSQKAGIPLRLSTSQFSTKPVDLQPMVVTAKKTMIPDESTFLLLLQPEQRSKFTSGDLLAIYPANDHRERLYSIGKIDDRLQLSIKLHPDGLGSGYLHALEPGAGINARIIANDHFHFPQKAPVVIMISNGTGIAPFLGMINQNVRKTDCRLYCGFRGAPAFGLYKKQLEQDLETQKLKQLHVAYSREGEKQYVRDLLERDADAVAGVLANNGVIMLCGSLSMQNSVIELLELICKAKNNKSVSYYQSHAQVVMDCY